jgi:hypothetical protein
VANLRPSASVEVRRRRPQRVLSRARTGIDHGLTWISFVESTRRSLTRQAHAPRILWSDGRMTSDWRHENGSGRRVSSVCPEWGARRQTVSRVLTEEPSASADRYLAVDAGGVLIEEEPVGELRAAAHLELPEHTLDVIVDRVW